MTPGALNLKLCDGCGLAIGPGQLMGSPCEQPMHRMCWDMVLASMGGVEAMDKTMAHLGLVELKPGVWAKRELVRFEP